MSRLHASLTLASGHVKQAKPAWMEMMEAGRLGEGSLQRMSQELKFPLGRLKNIANDEHDMKMFAYARKAMQPADYSDVFKNSPISSTMMGRLNTMALSNDDKWNLANMISGQRIPTAKHLTELPTSRPSLGVPKNYDRQPASGWSSGLGYLLDPGNAQNKQYFSGRKVRLPGIRGPGGDATRTYDEIYKPMGARLIEKLKKWTQSDNPRTMVVAKNPITMRHEMGHWLHGRMPGEQQDHLLALVAGRMARHDPSFLARVDNLGDDVRFNLPNEIMAQYLAGRPSGVGGKRMINAALKGYDSTGVQAMPNDRLKSVMAHLERNYQVPQTL